MILSAYFGAGDRDSYGKSDPWHVRDRENTPQLVAVLSALPITRFCTVKTGYPESVERTRTLA